MASAARRSVVAASTLVAFACLLFAATTEAAAALRGRASAQVPASGAPIFGSVAAAPARPAEAASGSSLIQAATEDPVLGESFPKILLDEEDLQDDVDGEGLLNEDDEDEDEEGETDDEGEDEYAEDDQDDDADEDDEGDEEFEDDILKLQRVGRRADANNDAMLSPAELREFAQALQVKHWRERSLWAHARADGDGDGAVALGELRASGLLQATLVGDHLEERFRSADPNGDGLLSVWELQAFLHPEVGGPVLETEVKYQMQRWDVDSSGDFDLEEFNGMGRDHSADFSEEASEGDFRLHDADGNGRLSKIEFERLLRGHDLLVHSIDKVMAAVDADGDGMIHVDHEMPHQVDNLLESEFIEDFFFHEHADRHDEL